ncbi:MAG: aspartate--tRNA ligase [Patescibacteria group bacterium]|nr:aspartate--tRNA ligase [Patescibacteria group bacterium]
MYRTHTCGELRAKNEGEEVTLAGWVHSIRTHGALTFIDLRDRYGITQITTQKEMSKELHKEFVVQIKGVVVKKPEANKALETGEIELQASGVLVLNKSKALPLDENASEETRLKYRYLDLRSKKMQRNLLLRHKAIIAVREYFDKHNFVEIETPVLGKSTPEGARDYLVPSRVNKHSFFALPQSPQIFKQLFQIAGLDRYVQIVKCFRDEDLRADRQPEFTQIDLEMSFVEEEDIYNLMEGMIKNVWKKTINVDVELPFKRIPYSEAMLKYGSDKPDLRFDLEIKDISDWAKKTDFKVFSEASCVRVIKTKGDFSRKKIDKLTDLVKVYGSKGLAWLKKEKGELSGGISKFIKELPFDLEEGEYCFFVADEERIVSASLGALRLKLGKELNLINKDEFNFAWVTDFPLMEWSEEQKRHVPMHHPFTSPDLDSWDEIKKTPEKANSRAYDLTLNGTELGGGSIRIHDRKLQEEVFSSLKISKKDQEEKFGFLLDAFSYGAPPHGGIAFGLDRIIMLLIGADNIREVIAFPKNKDAEDLMLQAPAKVSSEQLDELNISLKK